MPMITKLELDEIKKRNGLMEAISKKIRTGSWYLLENYKGWNITYPYCDPRGFTVMLMRKDKYSVHLIIGERMMQGFTMPLLIESDCCYSFHGDLDVLIEHLNNCINLKQEPNSDKR